MSTATVNGVDLFFDEAGAGEPILLHHGYTGSHDTFWEDIVPRLADRYRCIVMDSRGAGDSARPAEGHTIAQYARDVVAMADHLGLGRFTYVGHSMGGGIGMELGLEHPDRLERLVLVAPIPSGGVSADPALHEEQRALRKAPGGRARMLAERLVMRVRDTPQARVERNLDRALSVSDAHYDDSWASMAGFDVTGRLAQLTTPTLVIAGAADGLLEANLTDFMLLPNATLHVFSRVGHGVPGDVPDEFAAVIADFMEHGVVNAKTVAARVEAMRTAVR